MTNSRLKDYLDLWVLLDREALNANTLARAIAATFIRRGMPVPAVLPIGLTDEFATDVSRQAMWHAFLKKNEITITPLSDVVAKLRAILVPALVQAATFSDASRLVEIDKQDAS
jgi:Nucleotidyl transferase AbiEii toxin, Type IV TA system